MTKAQATAALVAKGIAPRGLTASDAAAYVGLSERTFRGRVKEGKLPRPHPATGRWDRAAIDTVLGATAANSPEIMRDEITAAIDSL